MRQPPARWRDGFTTAVPVVDGPPVRVVFGLGSLQGTGGGGSGSRHQAGGGQRRRQRRRPSASRHRTRSGPAPGGSAYQGERLAPYREVLGGLHHVAISMEPSRWEKIVARFDQAGVDYVLHNDVSVYFSDPDGARLELIADPLGEMYGHKVL